MVKTELVYRHGQGIFFYLFKIIYSIVKHLSDGEFDLTLKCYIRSVSVAVSSIFSLLRGQFCYTILGFQ